MKACVDCVHHKGGFWNPHSCYHPVLIRIYPVTGRVNAPYCNEERRDLAMDRCGPDGRMYQSKGDRR